MRRPLAALVAALALLAACGDDTSDVGAGDSTSTTAAGAPVPERIVSMSPSATEMLFAIGAGDQVVAVDHQSNFPEEAPTTDLSAYEPNVEAITAYDPDLVVLDATDPELIAGLETVGIEVLEAPAAETIDDSYEQIVELGAATGHEEEAADLVDSMQEDIEALLADVPERDEPLTFYHELDNTLYSVTSDTFIGELYVTGRPGEHRRPARTRTASPGATRSSRPSTSSRPTLTWSSWPTRSAVPRRRTPSRLDRASAR